MNPKYVCLCDNLTMNDKTSCVCEDKNLGPEDCDVLQALLKCNKTHRDCIYYRKYEEGHNRLRRVELNFDKFINATQVVFFEKPDFCLSSERISSNGTHDSLRK